MHLFFKQGYTWGPLEIFTNFLSAWLGGVEIIVITVNYSQLLIPDFIRYLNINLFVKPETADPHPTYS